MSSPTNHPTDHSEAAATTELLPREEEQERREMLISTHDQSDNNKSSKGTSATPTTSSSSSHLRQRLQQMHVPTSRDELREDVKELRTELDHVAHGNRATFLPGILVSVPGVLLSYIIQPFRYMYHLTHYFHQYIKTSSSSDKPKSPITSSWQRFQDRHRLNKQINRPPPMISKGHYHTEGDPMFDEPDIFGE